MRINAIAEPMKYHEHRETNNKNENNRKQNNNNVKVSFCVVLKRAKENL